MQQHILLINEKKKLQRSNENLLLISIFSLKIYLIVAIILTGISIHQQPQQPQQIVVVKK